MSNIIKESVEEMRTKVAALVEKEGGKLQSRQADAIIQVTAANFAALSMALQIAAEHIAALEAETRLNARCICKLIEMTGFDPTKAEPTPKCDLS